MTSRINLGPIISRGNIECIFSNDSNNLKIGHINAQSLCPSLRSCKLDELSLLLENSPLDILCITESWLDTTIHDQAINIPGYTVCRSDRPYGYRGGGVAIFIRDNLNFKPTYSCTEYFTCEGLLVEIYFDTITILIGVIYLPRGNLMLFDQFFGDFFVRHDNIILVGDFNIDLFNSSKSEEIHLLCSRYGLNCLHNSLPTHFDSYHQSTSLIDYFLVSQNLSVNTSNQFQLPFISHHSLICASFFVPVTTLCNTTYFRDYKNANIAAIEEHLLQVDFTQLYLTNDTNEQLDFSNSLFRELFKNYL